MTGVLGRAYVVGASYSCLPLAKCLACLSLNLFSELDVPRQQTKQIRKVFRPRESYDNWTEICFLPTLIVKCSPENVVTILMVVQH